VSVLVGLDVGTSSMKGVAIDVGSGDVLAIATRDLPLHIPQPHWAEQDGADFERSAIEVLAELARVLGERARTVRAIGLTGQMHSAMFVSRDGELVRRAMLWCDTRTTDECRYITNVIGRDGLRRMVKNAALEGFTLPKLLWLRKHEPDVYSHVHRVVMPKDLIGFRLSGVLETDVSDASGTLAFDPETRDWSRELLGALDVDPALFPRAAESIAPLGRLSGRVADATGLTRDVLVVRGGADNAAAAVGLGVVRTGRAMASIGTSGVVLAHQDALRVDDHLRTHVFCAAVPNAWYAMGVILSAGSALRWFRDTVSHRSYDDITALAATSKPGAGGVVFLPYLMGERTPHNDANARAAFVGMTARTTEADLARAVLEGVSFGLADCLDLMRDGVTELRATGGGSRSTTWRSILADILGLPIVLTTSIEGPSFGAAVLAGVGSGELDSVANAADALVKMTERATPTTHATFYRELHATYAALYGDLRLRFGELAARDVSSS
jgi:xylulokinase